VRKFQHIMTETPSELYGTFRSKLTILAGVPERGDIVSLAYGVSRGVPVIVLGQYTGDERTSHGSQFQGISPKDARALAAMLLEAAEDADPTVCPICKGTSKVERPSFSNPGQSVTRDCTTCRASGRLFPRQDQTFAVEE